MSLQQLIIWSKTHFCTKSNHQIISLKFNNHEIKSKNWNLTLQDYHVQNGDCFTIEAMEFEVKSEFPK